MNDKDKKKQKQAEKSAKKSLGGQVKREVSMSKPSSNVNEARAQMRKAGEDVIRTRQEIKRIASEPKGHFNKRVIGDPQKLSRELQGSLYAKENKRDSLRKVVRGYEKGSIKKK